MDEYKKAVKRLTKVESELEKRRAHSIHTNRAKESFEKLVQMKLHLTDFIAKYKASKAQATLTIRKERKPIVTANDRHIVKILNFIGEFNGLIPNEQDREALIKAGIKEFIPEKKQFLFNVITDDNGIVKIKIQK